jgi:hypothetical protein
MNFGRINDICNKVNFTTDYTYFTTPNNILSKYTQHFIRALIFPHPRIIFPHYLKICAVKKTKYPS